MSQLTPQQIVAAGTAPTFVAAGATDRAVVGSGRSFLHYKNGSGSPITVTVAGYGQTDYGVNMPSLVVSVPANGEALVPLAKDQDQLDGNGASITSSSQTSLTVALVVR